MNRPMDMRTMRDMMRGRGRRGMMSGRGDMAMDGRNPYGSRGGYVTSSRRGRRDRTMESDMARGGRGSSRGSNDYGTYDPEYDSRYDNDYATGEYNTRDSVYGRELYGYYGDTPFEIRRGYSMRDGGMDYGEEDMNYDMRMNYPRGGRSRDYGYDYRRDYGMDYGHGEYKLDKQDIEEWTKKLMQGIDEKEREMLHKEKVLNKAKEMGVKFEEFTPDEFYVAVIMMYSDHNKSFGNANIDTYLRMAKDFMEDPDVAVKYGEKLATYYDCIVLGE